ncbi:hypothetical protein YC2023_067262 [Brassica napus]
MLPEASFRSQLQFLVFSMLGVQVSIHLGKSPPVHATRVWWMKLTVSFKRFDGLQPNKAISAARLHRLRNLDFSARHLATPHVISVAAPRLPPSVAVTKLPSRPSHVIS